jgi:hypothetical protein
MLPGQRYPVSLTFKNTGDVPWTPSPSANPYRLGSQNPQDNVTWGRGRVEPPRTVNPGQTVTFAFTVTAPAVVGTYNFQWRMLQEGITWFGAFSPNVPVVVAIVRDAQFVSQVVPKRMIPGGSYLVSLTFKNTGSDWLPVGPSCNAYRLGAENPRDNRTWGSPRAELPAPVPAGQTVTIRFNVTAPATPGVYDFQWRMLQECVTWFGQPSTNVKVIVLDDVGPL